MVCFFRRAVAAALVAFVVSPPLAAQCGFQWLAGAPASGPDGRIGATQVLQNGDLVVAGLFGVADAVVTNNIARWDGATWQPLGGGTDQAIAALATMTNGDLVAGGNFSTAGGQPALGIAQWNGTAWSSMGSGFGGYVQAMQALPNGQLVVGGSFWQAPTGAQRVALWDGVAWTSLGSGIAAYSVNALARLQNGDLVVGGDLVGGAYRYPLKRWDGFVWQDVPGFDLLPFTISTIHRLSVMANGDLLILGNLSVNGVEGRLARWDGTTVQLLNTPLFTYGAPMLVASTGEVWIGGDGITVPALQRWNGTTWTSVPGAPLYASALGEDVAGRILVGSSPQTQPRQRAVSRYDGISWQDLGAPRPPLVYAMQRLQNGDLVVGGDFTDFRGVPANGLARWNGSTWSPLGAGVDGPVRSLTLAPDGALIVGGEFQAAGGAPANRVARWHGQSWSTLGGGLPTAPLHLAAAPTGEILAANGGALHRFNGLGWAPVLVPGVGSVQDLDVLPDGTFLLAGSFQLSIAPFLTGFVRLATTSTWAPVPGAPHTVFQILPQSGGHFLVRAVNGLWQWDGVNWVLQPALPAQAGQLHQLPDGSLVSVAAMVGMAGIEGGVNVVGSAGHGDLFAAGNTLKGVAGQIAFAFVHAVPSCRGSSALVGAGCTGGAGAVTLTAGYGPWAGGAFTTTTTGMTANSLALQLVGVQPTVQPLPGGAPGCSLFVQPVLADVFVPSGGAVTATFVVPNQPSLAGLQFRLQVVGIELDAIGIVRLTSSNAVEATIGAL